MAGSGGNEMSHRREFATRLPAIVRAVRFVPRDGHGWRRLARLPRAESLALAAIVLAAFVLRLYRLGEIPANVTADEADNARIVFRILETGEPGFFGLDWKPAPAFSLHLASWFVRVFGDGPFGIRMASATLTTLAMLPLYALARRVVGVPAALAAAILLGSGRWFLHFSRSGWENAQSALWLLLAGWALTVALERGQRRWFIFAGGAAALGLYGYFSGRLILPALLLYAPFAWWWAWRRGQVRALSGRTGQVRVRVAEPGDLPRGRATTVGFAILTITALLVFLPQARTIRQNWDYFNQRTANVNVLNQPRPYLGDTTASGIITAQVDRTLSAYIAMDGDLFTNGRYSLTGQPIVDRLTGVLFLFGLALGVRRWRATALWWCLLWVPLLGTQVLASRTPDAARAVIVAPLFCLFAVLPLDAVIRVTRARAHRLLPVAYLALALTVGFIAVTNVRDYFRWIATSAALEVRRPAETMESYPVWRDGLRCDFRGGTLESLPDGTRRCQESP